MTANIILDDTFPHGTPSGFRAGCRTAACPAPFPCRDIHRRYNGDFAFRKQIDAGTPIETILEREAEQARLALEAERAERRRRSGKRAKPKTGDRRAEANRARAGASLLIERTKLRALLDEGLTDRQIAERLGLKRTQVTQTRNSAGYARNPDQKGSRQGTIDARLPEVAHLSHEEAAKVLNRSADYVRRRRQIVKRLARETEQEAA